MFMSDPQEKDESHKGLILQETKPIKNDILLLCILLADLANGIVTEALSIRIENLEMQKEKKKLQTVSISIGFVFPVLAYLAAGIAFILYDYIYIRWKCKKSECARPSGLEWVKIFTKICTIIGSILYFIGDNMHKVFQKDKIHVIALVFLVLGILAYRIVPLGLKKLLNYSKHESKIKSRIFNCWSPNDNETDSLIVAYTYLLTVVVDFDIVLTIILKEADSNATKSLCNPHDEGIIWFLQASMTAIFIGFAVIIITILIIACRCSHLKSNLFKLILPKHRGITRIGCIASNIVLVVTVPIAVGMFLVADNRYLLECYKSDYKHEANLRVGFLSTSFVVFTAVAITFFCRRKCRCVQMKSKLISVDVLSDDELLIFFKEKSVPCSLKYNIPTSEITYFNCNHHSNHELCKNDIEHIVKLLGCIGKLIAVNVQNDQIVEVREIDGKLHVVVHNTSKSDHKVYSVIGEEEWNTLPVLVQDTHFETSHVDKISQSHETNADETQLILRDNYDSIVQPPDFRSGTLLVIYNQNDHICSIYLRKHEHKEYAVQVKKPRNGKNYDTFNVKGDQVVLRIEKRDSGFHKASYNVTAAQVVLVVSQEYSGLSISHGKYDPNVGFFRDEHVNEHKLRTQM